MELRYVGFEQTQNTRMYRFERVVKGEPSTRFVITADLALFLAHHIHIQEGPSLCATKLASDLESSWSGQHQLTDADLLAHVTARASAEALKIESRSRRAHRATTGSRNDLREGA